MPPTRIQSWPVRPLPGFQATLLIALLVAMTAFLSKAAAPDLQVLTNAARVLELTPIEAAKQHPVKLRGTLTFFDERSPEKSFRFLQDETAGIYIYPQVPIPTVAAGDRVEIEGITGRGEFAPVVFIQSLKILSHGGPLPVARPVTFEQLSSGQEDSQFVEISGIVRSVRLEEDRVYFVIEVATGDGRVTVYASELPVARSEDLVDSVVKVRGVCFTQFNRQRQIFNFGLLVPTLQDLVVEHMAQGDPFDKPAQPIESLLQYSARGSYGRRIKVVGTVNLRHGNRLYIQDGNEGLAVQTRQPSPLQVGDRVEVLGFPARGDYTPTVESAIYRKIPGGAPLRPEKITIDDALKGTFDCRLVTLEAVLLERSQHTQEPFLVLQSDDFVFNAYLHEREGNERLQALERGGKLAVTGVCVVGAVEEWHYGENWRVPSFRILMRSASDVTLVKAPPWWTLERLFWAAGILLGIVLAAFTWVAYLRRRVRKQTRIIEEKLQTEAALKERFQDLLENASDLVFTHDLNGRLTSINSIGERLMEMSRAALLSKNILELVAPEQRESASVWLADVLQGVEVPAREWDFISGAGQRIKLEINSRMIVQNGRKIEIEGIGRDVTERKRMEKEILEISNKEQQRIGHDLHDGVCQQLAAIGFRVHGMARRLQEKVPQESDEAERVGDLISETLKQTRGVARGLFPVRLERNGLVSALEELADATAARFGVHCALEFHEGLPEVDNSTALHLFYIAQEAITNSAKHSKATKILIRLAQSPSKLTLTVVDNGTGFQLKGRTGGGMGIAIMEYRARVIGASLELRSTQGQGTELSCGFAPSSFKAVVERE